MEQYRQGRKYIEIGITDSQIYKGEKRYLFTLPVEGIQIDEGME